MEISNSIDEKFKKSIAAIKSLENPKIVDF